MSDNDKFSAALGGAERRFLGHRPRETERESESSEGDSGLSSFPSWQAN